MVSFVSFRFISFLPKIHQISIFYFLLVFFLSFFYLGLQNRSFVSSIIVLEVMHNPFTAVLRISPVPVEIIHYPRDIQIRFHAKSMSIRLK